MTVSPHRVQAEIDLGALQRNHDRLKARLNPDVATLAVLKADAYGHGAIPCARALAGRVAMIGVGDSQEALELRRAGIDTPILVLGTIVEGEVDAVVEHGIHACIHDAARAHQLNAAAERLDTTATVHLLVDTGMHRLGVRHDQAAELLQVIRTECPRLRLDGICTHFSSPGEPNRAFTHRQLQRFLDVLSAARDAGNDPPFVHAAASSGVLNYPASHLTMVRLGLALHGVEPGGWPEPMTDLEPTLSLRTQVAFVKDVPEGAPVSYGRAYYTGAPTRIATLPVGYNDGYRRNLFGPDRRGRHAEVLINGRRCPVVGTITMDYTMVDVGAVGTVGVGDRVTLIGADGNDRILIDDLARLAGTIPYEIACGLGRRVVRLYRVREADPFVPAGELAFSGE